MVNNSTLTVAYTDFENGAASVSVEAGSALNWGMGMVALNAAFSTSDPYDFHLDESSPCIDIGTGDSILWPDIPVDDIDGDERPVRMGWDMGTDVLPNLPTVTPTPISTTIPSAAPTLGPVPATGPEGISLMLLVLSLILVSGISHKK